MFDLQSWSNEFFKQPTQPMSKEETRLFLNMIMVEQDNDSNNDFQTPEEVKNEFMYKIIDSRAKSIGLNLTETAKVFLMFLTQSPGTAVMYLYALRGQTTSVNMGFLANKFPMGFLTEQALSDMWTKQKGRLNNEKVDNCLDHIRFS